MASRCGAAMAAGASGGLVLAALVAWAAERDVLSFESASPSDEPAAWTASGERARIGIDRGTARHGAQSLRLEGEAPDAEARATIRLPVPSVEGNRLRITAAIKTERLEGSASLSLRVYGERALLYFDRAQLQEGAGTSTWLRLEVATPVFAAASGIEIGLGLHGRGKAWFDDVAIESLDTAALPLPAPGASRYLERALEIIGTHSMMRASIDWHALRAGALAQARGAVAPADTHIAVRYVLARLGDHHSYLLTPERAAALDSTPVSNARTGRQSVRPEGRRLGAGAAYLSIPGFAGGTHSQQVELAETLQMLIRGLDVPPTCGWIVDLRGNTGGNLWPMLAGIGPLVIEGEAAAAAYPDGRRASIWYRGGAVGLGTHARLRVRGEAYRLRAPHTRIAVLLGPRTASSGEILAIALTGPGRRSFGAPTRGLATGNRTFELSDGAALVLAVAATTDRSGRRVEGPIVPVERVAAGGADPLEQQQAVRAALGWLARECRDPSGGGIRPKPADPSFGR